MPSLFTRPIEVLSADDVTSILGWPEFLTTEFKQDLSSKRGGADPWIGGGNVGDYARLKLLREIVALANTQGGHLVLGIEEDRSVSPRIAGAIKPISRCVVLAERLSQMAQHIDPPIPLLLVKVSPLKAMLVSCCFGCPGQERHLIERPTGNAM